MIQIIIADDHQLFADGMASLLKTIPDVLLNAIVHNGKELLEKIEHTPCDLVLMDMNMPEMDGLETTKILKKVKPELKVLMVTMSNTKEHITKLLAAGADGYLLKNTGKEELEKAIRVLMSGDSFYSKEVTERIMEGLQKKKTQHTETYLIELTEREKEVLKLIALECTTAEIAEKLFISTHTVETHRKNLISKLQVKNIAGLVRYAVQQGFID